MKTTLAALVLLLSFNAIGQTQIDKKYTKNLCDCLDQMKSTTGVTKDGFVGCFQNALLPLKEEIMAEVSKLYNDTSYESGYKYGKQLAERAAVNLVMECRTYYEITDSMRYISYTSQNPDSVRAQIKEMEEVPEVLWDDEYYNERAELYFTVKMYDKALGDVNKVLETSPDDFTSLFLKGWIHEEKGEYDEAIKNYTLTAEKTGMNNFLVFAAVAKRKKAEKR